MVLLKIKTILENNCCTYWSAESCETAFPTSEKKNPWSIMLIRKVDITQTRGDKCKVMLLSNVHLKWEKNQTKPVLGGKSRRFRKVFLQIQFFGES
jgi:hypothetical protein